MPAILIVGATRGLGAALVQYYSSNPYEGTSNTIYATTRSSSPPSDKWAGAQNVHWLLNIDLSQGPSAAKSLADQITTKSSLYSNTGEADHLSSEAVLAGAEGSDGKLNTIIITAGYFATEDYGQSKWDEEVKMYTLSSIAPVFVVEALDAQKCFVDGTKVVLVSSESGSVTLRHEQEGGGNFGHHGSKAALNMVGRQLSFDLKGKGVAVGIVHPSFMRTDMTKGVGFDKFWDDGGALPPDEAAKILADWVEKDFDMKLTGTYWAPRGTQDIGNWDVVMGKKTAKEGPVQLPW